MNRRTTPRAPLTEIDCQLAAAIRAHREQWFPTPPADEACRARDDALIACVLDRAVATRANGRTSRRRRWIGGGVAAVLVLSGATVAAAVLRRNELLPEVGATCRSTAALTAGQFVLAPGQDPLSACAQLWVAGDIDPAVHQAPILTSCAGLHGAVEVFPGDARTCAALGLQSADAALSTTGSEVVDLLQQVDTAINAAIGTGGCISVTDAVHTAGDLLAASGFNGWTVTIEPGTDAGACAKAFVDSTTKRIVISAL
ncbi:MAG TPA: hypothetical protein VGM78_09175 [Ilumatobacteraceae bacterium]